MARNRASVRQERLRSESLRRFRSQPLNQVLSAMGEDSPHEVGRAWVGKFVPVNRTKSHAKFLIVHRETDAQWDESAQFSISPIALSSCICPFSRSYVASSSAEYLSFSARRACS